MAIDRFSLDRFAAALPKRKPVGEAPAESLAVPVGMVQGEECFIIQPFPAIPVGLFIRSSVDATGFAAATGEDSIRVLWCALSIPDIYAPGVKRIPYAIIGNKAKAYTTRVAGWEDRLTALLRKLAAVIRWCVPCPKCGERLIPFTTKKGDNAGRCFVNCAKCRNGDKSAVFYWTEDENEKPIADLPPELGGKKCAPKSPGAIVCPNCHSATAPGVSQYPQNGSHHCFRKRGGCGHCWTPGENDGLTTPANAPQATNAADKGNAPAPTERPASATPATYNEKPPTVPELVEAVEDMIEALHEPYTSEELVIRLRTHPACAHVARLVQRFHSSQPAHREPKAKRTKAG